MLICPGCNSAGPSGAKNANQPHHPASMPPNRGQVSDSPALLHARQGYFRAQSRVLIQPPGSLRCWLGSLGVWDRMRHMRQRHFGAVKEWADVGFGGVHKMSALPRSFCRRWLETLDLDNIARISTDFVSRDKSRLFLLTASPHKIELE